MYRTKENMMVMLLLMAILVLDPNLRLDLNQIRFKHFFSLRGIVCLCKAVISFIKIFRRFEQVKKYILGRKA